MFHTSHLERVVGDAQQVQVHPPQCSEVEEFELQVCPENILGIRWNSELCREEWLIKWEKLLDSEATWQEAYFIKHQFPELLLEDKVHLETWGIVRPPIHHTYKRRGKKDIPHGQDVSGL